MSNNYRVKTDRAARSSYGAVAASKRRSEKSLEGMRRGALKPRGAQHDKRVNAAPVPVPTQRERVTWARTRWLEAFHRAKDHPDDAVYAAAVRGRRLELDREVLALERLTSPPKPLDS